MYMLHVVHNGRTLCGAPRATLRTADRNRPHCAKCVRVQRIIAASNPRRPVTVRNFKPSDNPIPSVHNPYGKDASPGERYRRQAA